ncbi:MAG: response regulator [Bacteroidetes bacterium]|nr:response regulator [Bacteroidota bacterium]
MYELYHLVLNAGSEEKQELMFTVSIIDDDPMFREALKDYLQSMKIEQVECFSTGEEFILSMKKSDKRLVICDFDFGTYSKMNGLQVMEEIRKRDPKIPVIILSAQDNIAIALKALKNGAVDYYMKGTESTFTTVLTTILKINELQRLRKNERDYIRALVAGSVVSIIVIGFLLFLLSR